MPTHLADHFANGHHTWGVIVMRQGFATSRYVGDLILVAQVTSADEWLDRMEYIPFET
jgi:hypothetical protein